MKKILIPVDGTERSEKPANVIRKFYSGDAAEIYVILVREDYDEIRSAYEMEERKEEAMLWLDKIEILLNGYIVHKEVLFGRAGEEILNYAKENKIDVIVMTKSTKIGWARIIGSVTSHVIKYAKCAVMITPEN